MLNTMKENNEKWREEWMIKWGKDGGLRRDTPLFSSEADNNVMYLMQINDQKHQRKKGWHPGERKTWILLILFFFFPLIHWHFWLSSFIPRTTQQRKQKENWRFEHQTGGRRRIFFGDWLIDPPVQREFGGVFFSRTNTDCFKEWDCFATHSLVEICSETTLWPNTSEKR